MGYYNNLSLATGTIGEALAGPVTHQDTLTQLNQERPAVPN